MAHKKGHNNWSDKSYAAKERITAKLTDVYEGDRIKGAMDVLAAGGSDKEARSYVEGEFPKGTIKIIKKAMGLNKKK
jgi:hypothetical protein